MFKDLYLFMKDIYQNRKLLLQFSINDFKSRYAGSFLESYGRLSIRYLLY